MDATAPGKVILSGEHSVVYGAPAIALAVSEHIHARFEPAEDPMIHLRLGDAGQLSFPCQQLDALRQMLDERFDAFTRGTLPVSDILDQPAQLLLYVMALSGVRCGGTLTTTSTLPTGSGMGSSAAAIAATLILSDQISGVTRSQQQRFDAVRYCERLQHGRGSAIDAAAVTYGGLVQVQQGVVTQLEAKLGSGWYRIDTGRPEVSTGECVEAVRNAHAGSGIWDKFAVVSSGFADVLSETMPEPDRIIALIRKNHRLLQQIGVVPAPVAAFIDKIEALGGAAKISGAGAHRGSAGGLVLAYLPHTDPRALCIEAGYRCAVLNEDVEGAHILHD